MFVRTLLCHRGGGGGGGGGGGRGAALENPYSNNLKVR